MRLHKVRGNVLLLDIGHSNIGGVVADVNMVKSRKRKEDSMITENPLDPPKILTRIVTSFGSKDLNALIGEKLGGELSFEEIMEIKEHLQFGKTVIIDDKELNLSLDDKSDVPLIKVINTSEALKAFKILLRNLIVKAGHRGIDKGDITHVILTGDGAKFPPYEDHLQNVFPEIEIMFDDDPFLVSKGVGLISNGQGAEFVLDNDYFIRVANKGSVSNTYLLNRGETVFASSKIFTLEPLVYLDKIVIDCWVRKPKFLLHEEVIPKRDNEALSATDQKNNYKTDRVFRKLIDIDKGTEFRVQVSKTGKLSFEVTSKGEQNRILTTVIVS